MEFGLTFPSYWEWNFIIPTDEVHHFSEGEGEKPPTSCFKKLDSS
jgi:hypothetical protein